MILVLDNYDSFTYNLVHLLGAESQVPRVCRNDKVRIEEIREMRPDGIVISPGPGRPENAGITVDLVRELKDEIPILGVCLGHQAICAAFGADIVRADVLMHGKTSPIQHDGKGVFVDIPSPFDATRYHSLVVDPSTLPSVLAVSAETADGTLMAVRHRNYPLVGIQFHPESILTRYGSTLARNWLGEVSTFHEARTTT